ncbi:MAG: bifunctional 5,10-methylenetetrahydrofolate dehydrogenase/5,10-methenyltetrahydrofolate cyclohydrolase [Synergistaceae bacterium]|nr:bifunctional 5,10-methylenetetrahydrofolate dehydrogenase/5,10-methenyltetrahydrofolate cyclohydrolase [Synergistaceae bacterium]
MPIILDGKQVASAINERVKRGASALRARGTAPGLAIVRVGERPDDAAYERGAVRRCESAGIDVRCIGLPEDTPQDVLLRSIRAINDDESIHGCLLLRPLPKHIDDSAARNALSPSKDVDGVTDMSLAGVFAGTRVGFPPCAPEACMEILDHYGVDAAGMRAVVIGRSLVVGKPAAMMLLERNATVTICHTQSRDMPEICRNSDLLIVSVGRASAIGRDFFNRNQIVIDVGINADENGALRGDVNWEEASMTKAITPVPGGVGAVTTSALASHVITAASRASGI